MFITTTLFSLTLLLNQIPVMSPSKWQACFHLKSFACSSSTILCYMDQTYFCLHVSTVYFAVLLFFFQFALYFSRTCLGNLSLLILPLCFFHFYYDLFQLISNVLISNSIRTRTCKSKFVSEDSSLFSKFVVVIQIPLPYNKTGGTHCLKQVLMPGRALFLNVL